MYYIIYADKIYLACRSKSAAVRWLEKYNLSHTVTLEDGTEIWEDGNNHCLRLEYEE